MKLKLACFPILLSALVPAVVLQASNDSQTINVSDKLQIPGATLKSGSYTFDVEDRLADRAIVRVTTETGDRHYLLLAVPNGKLSTDSASQLLYFSTKEDKKNALRAWKCPTCAAPLEFVYAKLDAVKITDESTQPVLAVDPTYDKLPANLSPDDMKVVTLWLLAPERITADNVGKGVKAAKYSPDSEVATQETASSAVPPPAPVAPGTPPSAPAVPSSPDATVAQTAPAPVATAPASTTSQMAMNSEPHVPGRKHLPKTASDNDLFLLCGLGALVGAAALRMQRVRAGQAR